MKRWQSTEVRSTIARMRLDEQIPVSEIQERLANKAAGLDYAVTISKRQIHYYLQGYREERIRKAADNPDSTRAEVAQQELRLVDRFRQEIDHLEGKPIGRISAEDARRANAIHKALIDIERRAKHHAKRTPGQKQSADTAPAPGPLDSLAARLATQKEPTSGLDSQAQTAHPPAPEHRGTYNGDQRSAELGDGATTELDRSARDDHVAEESQAQSGERSAPVESQASAPGERLSLQARRANLAKRAHGPVQTI